MSHAEMSCSLTPGESLIKLKHKWTIQQFSYRNGVLKSSTFWATEHEDDKWHIRIFPLHCTTEGVSIFLSRETERKHKLTVKHKLILLNSEGKVLEEDEDNDIFTRDFWDDCCVRFVSRTKLLPELVADDTLIILCEISYLVTNRIITEANKYYEPPSEFEIPKCKQLKNLEVLLETGDFSDVVLDIETVQLSFCGNVPARKSD